MNKISFISLLFILITTTAFSQNNSLVNTSQSPYAKLYGINVNEIELTEGFWAERFNVCAESMLPHMLANYMDSSISHAFTNFEIAAGLKKGEHIGPPFHDGDFYKLLEGMIMVYSVKKDPKMLEQLDYIIDIIGRTQREDGYIHTPVVIKQINNQGEKKEFAERLDFETYNMGHLMTAACLHYRVTGKKDFLNIAIKATDFLYDFYKRASAELARNAICPSHYMGVIEMYRTTRDPRYLELAKQLIEIRSMVENGTDHNQDRIPFKQQTQAVGHAVRANYLYAGVADVYTETGDDSLLMALDKIWHDLTERKLYITGACGALYDGVSPDGTSYSPPYIQQVHQAYGRDYQLPNLTAHNESCANIGNILWNWRMLEATAQARFADAMERTMYNALLSAVSLDGTSHFYTNPLCVADDIPFTLRWSKEREGYISYCNCCPPNTIRTIAEIQNYMYSLSDNALWVNIYGGNKLDTKLKDGSTLQLIQVTDYPWNGNIKLTLKKVPKGDFSIHLRIPEWCDKASLTINGKAENIPLQSGVYAELKRQWKKGDEIYLQLDMKIKLMESNPLVEETRNQVAVQRGPVVYCLESVDLPDNSIFNVSLPVDNNLQPVPFTIGNSKMMALEGDAIITDNGDWSGQLYKEIAEKNKPVKIRLIPYYAWDNRGKSEMSVWIPVKR